MDSSVDTTITFSLPHDLQQGISLHGKLAYVKPHFEWEIRLRIEMTIRID